MTGLGWDYWLAGDFPVLGKSRWVIWTGAARKAARAAI